MNVVVGGWFSLPRLGTDVFSSLMKAGVKYEKGKGFMFTPDTDIQRAARTIENATGEQIALEVRCYVCSAVACPGCSYQPICDRRSVSPMCLCDEHLSSDDAFETYEKVFEAYLTE